MNSNSDKSAPVDPENELRILELELMRQRASRQTSGRRYRGLRNASFAFAFLVLLTTLLALYYFYFSGDLNELRSHQRSSRSANVTSGPP